MNSYQGSRLKGLLFSIVSLSLSLTVGASEIQTIEKLVEKFPPTVSFDHGADLLALETGKPAEVFEKSIEDVDGLPFKQCVTLDIKKPGDSPWGVKIGFQQKHRWQPGDTGMVAFYCRTLATKNKHGASSILLQYKPDYDDWRGYLQTDLFLTKEWKLVMIPFEVKLDAGDTPSTVFQIFFGGVDPQTIQFADLHLFSYGKNFPLAQLPQSKAYYPGVEEDAEWRKIAKQRIEKNRRANFQINIKDAAGKPLSAAKVHVKLKRHKFGFGAAVRSSEMALPKVGQLRRDQYSEVLTRTCSKITPTNAMKWRLHAKMKNDVEGLLKWAKENDMTVRGHLFIWPGFERLPDGYDLHKKDAKAFRLDLVNHIKEFANLYPDAFSEWDVMNEPYTEHAFMDLLGKDVVLEWFKTAREANPNYLNYINDYGILSGNNNEHQNNYHEWITYLVENNAPFEGIGFQGHYTAPMPPEVILERINRYGKFGKKMQITEFDFDHADSDLQAKFFEDFVTLIYSHPKMEALVNWIFLEDDFRPNAALYRSKDFSPTSMGKVWEKLITETWATEETLKTDANGALKLRGYKGLYQIEVEHNGETQSYSINLVEDGNKELTYTK